MITESKDDITPQLCISHFTGIPCTKEGCNCLHLVDYQITINELLDFNDLFYVKDQTNGVLPAKANFTEREKELLQSAPRPVLCDICSKPIKVDDSFYFECCCIYTCKQCLENWHFKKCCPSCGKYYEEPQEIPPEKIEEIEQKNAPFLSAQIIPFE